MKSLKALTILATLLAAGQSQAAVSRDITFTAPPVYPEGIAYDPLSESIFVSSMKLGKIGRIPLQGKGAGVYQAFSKDSDESELISIVGIHADAARGRLIACVSDPGVSVKTKTETQKKIARLVIFDLATGDKKKTYDLAKLHAGAHFCNDIAVSPAGEIFATDSFSPVIYKVTVDGNASVFMKDERFAGEGFNLNGIVYMAGDYLLVTRYNDGTLWKIDAKNPARVTQVKLPKTFKGADGLVYLRPDTIALIQNDMAGAAAAVHKLHSRDDWATAKVVKSTGALKNAPTTGVLTPQGLLVLESQLNVLFGGKSSDKPVKFTVRNLARF